MSSSILGTSLSSSQLPRLYTARAGAHLSGVSAPTVRKLVKPDAWLISERGDKKFPVYTEETLRAFAAERKARGGVR
jgi:hypothetical protein